MNLDLKLECKMLESTGFGGNMVALEEETPRATVTKLPDVDDPAFQEFIKNDAVIVNQIFNYILMFQDKKLVEIEKGVFVLRDIALNLGKEIDKQTEMIDKDNALAEKTNIALDNINLRMKKTLDSVN